MTDIEEEKTTLKTEYTESEAEEKTETQDAEFKARIRAAAVLYAKYLKENNLAPGDASFAEPEELGVDFDALEAEAESVGFKAEEIHEDKAPEEEAPEPNDEPEKPEAPSKAQEAREKKIRKYRESFLKVKKNDPLSKVTDLHDKVQDGIDGFFGNIGKDIVVGAHRITSSYRNSRRGIGAAILFIGILAAVILIIFDRFTVYEYAYNGKVLGYVQEQEEVTDVLDVAGRKLSGNTNSDVGVEFAANQNVTFNLTDGRGKSTDDSDTVTNKLIYMTDIETEAYAVYDGDNVVAIVKDSSDAETLLNQTMAELSKPDAGMKLVSAKFTNNLDAKPVNVLLGSVQSNAAALSQMIGGGEMATYHIVEEGETAQSIAEMFGVEVPDIYDEENSGNVTEVEQGDKVCIRSVVAPVSVKMVETGKIKETIEFKTIKKETDKYYKGDTYLEQEGVDGVQIFEGTITKVAGEVTDRDEISTEVLKKKKDKIILIGTAERPKTAATGTFKMPIQNYVVTSEWGGRWGRMHEGMDFGAPTGTPIYASDGGKVIRAGWFSGHGMCVEIDHDNGVVTRYSHCSAILVNVGDLVYQGQNIAKVGNTGHSFGSHLHFEVRIDGSSQNPRKYVNP